MMSEYRGYRISFINNMVKITMKGSGALPDALKGLYTSKHAAMKAIDFYADSKGKKRASNKSSS